MRVHLKRVGRRWDHKDLHWSPKPRKISTRAERSKKKAEDVSPQIWPLCVQLSYWPSLTLPICPFRVLKGKEKKLIIFLYISVAVFLCYTTLLDFLMFWHTKYGFLRACRVLWVPLIYQHMVGKELRGFFWGGGITGERECDLNSKYSWNNLAEPKKETVWIGNPTKN